MEKVINFFFEFILLSLSLIIDSNLILYCFQAVSIGMVKEAELARNLGHFSQANLGRLIRCLQVCLSFSIFIL